MTGNTNCFEVSIDQQFLDIRPKYITVIEEDEVR